MTHATRAALFVCFIMALIVVAQVINYVIITRYIGHTEVQWCDTLRLLTSQPVPKGQPVQAYQLFHDFQNLKDRFGCR